MIAPISVAQLAEWLADAGREPPQMVDVREPWEHGICSIAGATLMPLGSVAAMAQTLDPDRPLVCICHHGARSAHAAMFLQRQGHGQVLNLTGGIDAWARTIDPTMATY